MARPYLNLDHISKTFVRGGKKSEVLHDVNLTIEKDEYVSIIGH
jgi:nitrate/nitrite transport system ATP-binding protein